MQELSINIHYAHENRDILVPTLIGVARSKPIDTEHRACALE